MSLVTLLKLLKEVLPVNFAEGLVLIVDLLLCLQYERLGDRRVTIEKGPVVAALADHILSGPQQYLRLLKRPYAPVR